MLQKVLKQYPLSQSGRLTLTTSVPVTTADVTAALLVYYTPYVGEVLTLFNGSVWVPVTYAELSLKATDTAQTGTMTNGTKVITGLTNTGGLVRGMQVTGTSVGASAVIVTIDSATQVTVDVNSTGSTTNAVTFKLPINKNYDIFAVLSSGAAALRYSNAWSGDTTRTDALGRQNNWYVNNAAINSGDSNSIAAKQGLYLGTIRTTGTAGQLEDSYGNASQAGGHRYIWNYYNRVERNIGVIDTTDSWVYSTATWRQAQAAAGNKVEYVCGVSEDLVQARVRCYIAPTAGNQAIAVGIDVTNSPTEPMEANIIGPLYSFCEAYPGIGYHYLAWLEYTRSGTGNWFGDGALTTIVSGLKAVVKA